MAGLPAMEEASRTAVLVAQARAAAHGRIAPGRFADPTAMPMLRDEERRMVELVRSGDVPASWSERVPFELIRASSLVLAARTIEIDAAVVAVPPEQVVLLGAGLDGRAWRLPDLSSASVFEVDHPASQQDKRARARALPPPPPGHRYVAVDFLVDDVVAALAAAGHRRDRPTTWIWEGVVPYLRRAAVVATMRSIDAASAAGSRLIVNYQSPAASARLGRLLIRVLGRSGTRKVLSGEPIRSTWRPDAMRRLCAHHRFEVASDRDLLEIAQEQGIPAERYGGSLSNGRVAVAVRAPRA